MDDFDNLNSKTDSDLRQIAVAFGDFTPEEAESKTRDELIMAITGAKDIGDVTVVDLAEDPVPMRTVPIPETMKSTENMKSLDELIVDVGRTARFETNELAEAMLKAERSEEKKVAKKETVAEEKPAEITEAVADVKKTEDTAPAAEEKKAEKKTAKKTDKKSAGTSKRSKAKAEESAPEKAEEAAPAEVPSGTEEKAAKAEKAEKKTSSRTKKAKNSKKKEDAAAEEAKPEE